MLNPPEGRGSVDVPIPAKNAPVDHALLGATATTELKRRSVRGGAVTLLAQGLIFGLQTASTIILARLLSPKDFGLLGMVAVVTGFLFLFRDAGLGVAVVQREVLTHEQASTLFWINVAVGAVLTIATAAMAPLLVAFYREPRLLLLTIISSVVFVIHSVTVQHRALLSRAMRFSTMAKIDVLALAISGAVAVLLAAHGYGYWALVGMTLGIPVVTAASVWFAIPWLPGRPRRGTDVRSMLHFGGTVTLNNLVVYLAYNAEKVLLGRFWGAEALGLYGRAYQLVNLPVQQLNSAIGGIGYAALSRAQGQSERLRRSFLQGYSVLVSISIPAAVSSAVFAAEIVHLILGPNWSGAVVILRLLAPAVLAFALINPFGWLLQATGRVRRSLHMALVIAPIVIVGIVSGLRYGPAGVAFGYSAAMVLLVVPCVIWAIRGTGMTIRDYWDAVRRPLVAAAIAGAVGWLVKLACEDVFTPIPRLLVAMTLFIVAYAWILLIVMGQRNLYVDLLRQLLGRDGPARENAHSREIASEDE